MASGAGVKNEGEFFGICNGQSPSGIRNWSMNDVINNARIGAPINRCSWSVGSGEDSYVFILVIILHGESSKGTVSFCGGLSHIVKDIMFAVDQD